MGLTVTVVLRGNSDGVNSDQVLRGNNDGINRLATDLVVILCL